MKDKFKKIRFKVSEIFSKHQAFVVMIVFLAIFATVIYRLTILSNIKADQTVIDDQTATLKTINFNQDAIDKIEQLKDSNVKTPGTQLQKDRQNPFAE